MTSHRNTASLFDAAEFPQNEEAGESDECEVAEGKAPAGYGPGYPPYGGQYAARAQGRSPAPIAHEAQGYDVRSNTCSGVCGHYTQIVWGTTRAVACAVATDRRREVWVCNYDPPGNIVGYRPY